MRSQYFISALALTALASTPLSWGQAAAVPLDLRGLQARNVSTEVVTYQGRNAVRVADTAPADIPDGQRFAIIAGTDFTNGVIELDLVGDTLPGAAAEFRGFTGLAFRMSQDGTRYETFYLRPRNGRAEDQLQRNHAVQYEAPPDFPWQRLRMETPGKYETYADLVMGEWTHVKIEVQGDKARLYVNGVAQPTLVVNDLKNGQSKGALALWIGPKTVAHFANLQVTRH
jgi:hypothetical protein